MKLLHIALSVALLSTAAYAQSELEKTYASLKEAEAKKDSDAILKAANATSAAARKAAEAPKGEDQSDADHKAAVDYAKQVDTYTEYALYAAALGESDPQKAMRLTTALEERNPKSQYFMQMMPKFTAAARQAGAMPAAIALGERAYARGQFNEDLLLAMADQAMNQKNYDKTVEYSAKVVDVMNTQAKPEGIADADWTKKKNTTLGLAYWMQGMSLMSQNKLAPADKAFRSAVPLVKDMEQLAGPALFQLGLANYKMAQASKSKSQATEAIGFFRQAAVYKGPSGAQATKNIAVVQKEFGVK